jgi:hypothetical protein
LKVWRGEKPKAKDTGEVDRSASLMKIGRTIYDAGATRRTVAEALKERDLALGGKCYTNRSDADKQYQNIADKLEVEGRNPYIPIRPNGRNSHSRIGDVNVNESENGSSPHPKRSLRGCYELRLGNGSILAWLLENHTQVTFPTKSGRLLPLIWRSFEKTLHSATTSCARSSTG